MIKLTRNGVLILITIIIAISGCVTKEKPEEIKTVDLREIIKSVSRDYLLYNDPIVLKLHDNEILNYREGKKVEELEVEFQPEVAGQLEWIDETTMYFVPVQPLKQNTKYKYSIKLRSGLQADSLSAGLYKEISFLAIGQDIEKLDYQIVFSEEDANIFYLEGELELLSKASTNDLAKAVKVEYKGKYERLMWQSEDSRRFTFKSKNFQFDAEAKELKFLIEGKRLDLAYDVERSFDINKESQLYLRSAEMFSQENEGYIELVFSDDLHKAQNLRSLITLTPQIEYELESHDNIIRLIGVYSFEQLYKVEISDQIKSSGNKKPARTIEASLAMEDLPPKLLFSDEGVFLTSSNQNNLHFQTLNVKQVHYSIIYIFENNISYFLQEADLQSTDDDWRLTRNLQRVGKTVSSGKLEIGNERNCWLQHEMNISSLLPKNSYGIYIVNLHMNQKDVLYRENSRIARTYRRGNDPMSYSYYYHNGKVIKPVIVSDLAITCKSGKEATLCAVTNVVSGKPVKSARVSLIDYTNQLIAEGHTDNNGLCRLECKETPFLVLARYNDQESVLKLHSDQWETSVFNTSGVSGERTKQDAYIYTERGVYRPGDKVNFAIILRNQDGSFPADQPITVELFDPGYKLIYSSVLKESRDGFYHFPYETALDDPTGSWNLKIHAGGSQFGHELRLETIAPERLKLTYHPESESIPASAEKFEIGLEARYLFGRAAAGLTARFDCETTSIEKRFPDRKWDKYSFNDAASEAGVYDKQQTTTTVDENGIALFEWQRPEGKNFSSAGIVKLSGEVINRGGRASEENLNLPWDPWTAYVGINASSSRIKANEKNEIQVILLDEKGKPLSGEDLQVRIFENNQYWWWEYDNYRDFRQRYKQARSTRLVKEDIILSSFEPAGYVIPKVTGRNILLEITHLTADGDGHTSSKIFFASQWADKVKQDKANIIELRSDKDKYYLGETAHIKFPINDKAKALITLEKGNEIMDWWWYEAAAGKTQADVSLTLTPDMHPGIYVSVSVIQSQNEKISDCPLRLYGILPLTVTDRSTVQQLSLKVPEIIKPQEKFTCRLKAEPGGSAQFTVAVVDEGLLSLTNFESPDAWEYFYKKQRLEVISADNYEKFIGIRQGDIARRFKIGGGMESAEMFKKRQIEKTEIKRFEPVCLFSGILRADSNGEAEVEFMMPDYLGAVRIMAVCVSGNSYGSAEKTVTVRKELMLMPTLPRALAPGDKFIVPVEVFAFEKEIAEAQVEISAEGPVKIKGAGIEQIELNDRGEGLVLFEAEMAEQLKPVSVRIRVFSGKFEHESVINIPVRHLQPYMLASQRKLIKAGDQAEFKIERDGISGTESSYLIFNRPGYFDYNKHLSYLIRYPYGCLEQTVSSVFPQLFISRIIDPALSLQIMGKIDENIAAAFDKMIEHQLFSGGFSYWRSSNRESSWTTIYATHFLLEAAEQGYHIPAAMDSKVITYLSNNVMATYNKIDRENSYKKTAYQLYVLARAGKPQFNQMNYLYQSKFDELGNTERWLLAAAYHSAGQAETARAIQSKAGIEIQDSPERWRYNYGSIERDQALILALACQLKQEDVASRLFDTLTKAMKSKEYFSTQTRSFLLWGLSSYAEDHPEAFTDAPVEFTISEAAAASGDYQLSDDYWQKNIGEEPAVKIKLERDSAPAEFTLYYDRVPAEPVSEVTNETFSLSRTLMDMEKNPVKCDQLVQGNTYLLKIKVQRRQMLEIDNMALTQILPSGWEIVNERLSGNNSIENNADYVDIRDDRVIWFFDYTKNYSNNTKTYQVKLRAVTAGEFELPPTQLEAMYSPDYTVILPGGKIKISR